MTRSDKDFQNLLGKRLNVDDDTIKTALMKRWFALYMKCRDGDISEPEYTRRRRAYKTMIEELGGFDESFVDVYKERIVTPRTKKNLFSLLFSLGFERQMRLGIDKNIHFVFNLGDELLVFPKGKRLQEYHWMTARKHLDANGHLTAEEFDKKFEIG